MTIRYGEVLSVEAYYQQLGQVGKAFDGALDVLYADWAKHASVLAHISRIEHALLLYGSNGEGPDSNKPPKTDSDIDPEAILHIPGLISDRAFYSGAILLEMAELLGKHPYVDSSHPSTGLTGTDYGGILTSLSAVRYVDRRRGVTLLTYEGSEVSKIVSLAGRETGVRVNVVLIQK